MYDTKFGRKIKDEFEEPGSQLHIRTNGEAKPQSNGDLNTTKVMAAYERYTVQVNRLEMYEHACKCFCMYVRAYVYICISTFVLCTGMHIYV